MERPWIALEAVEGPSEPTKGLAAYAVAAGDLSTRRSRADQPPDGVGSLACCPHSHPLEGRWPVRFVTREPCWGLDQWLEAAEKELVRGADHVVLLEAGTNYPDGPTFLDIATIPRARAATHLPVVVDVPRVAGRRTDCSAVASAAIAAGASGVILRAWIGAPGQVIRTPATLSWEAAVALAQRLHAIGEAARA